MEPNHNIVGWLEIPVTDMERAIRFYEAVLDMKLSRNQMGPLDMAWFPWVEKAGGNILQGKTLIAEDYGYMAIILDSEGNRIALHSRK